MTEEQRRQIEEQADIKNRLQNLEKGVESIFEQVKWGLRAIWGGIAYLAFRLIEFVLNGGSIK